MSCHQDELSPGECWYPDIKAGRKQWQTSSMISSCWLDVPTLMTHLSARKSLWIAYMMDLHPPDYVSALKHARTRTCPSLPSRTTRFTGSTETSLRNTTLWYSDLDRDTIPVNTTNQMSANRLRLWQMKSTSWWVYCPLWATTYSWERSPWRAYHNTPSHRGVQQGWRDESEVHPAVDALGVASLETSQQICWWPWLGSFSSWAHITCWAAYD